MKKKRMKKKIIIGTVVAGLFFTTIGICLGKDLTKESSPQKENNNQSTKIVDVDEVVNNPERYRGFLGVEGSVISIDKSKNIFLLGCEDACVFMPVKYKGQMPEAKSKIIVYGEIKKQEDGKYIFQGKEVKTR